MGFNFFKLFLCFQVYQTHIRSLGVALTYSVLFINFTIVAKIFPFMVRTVPLISDVLYACELSGVGP